MAGNFFGLEFCARLLPLVNLCAQKLGVLALVRAETVPVVRHGREVDDCDHAVALAVSALVYENILQVVVIDQPLEAAPIVVYFVHGGVILVNAVERRHELFEVGVRGIVEHRPIELLCEIPLVKLSELRAHEQQLFAGVREHVRKEIAHARELHVVIAGHFVDERALAVNDLVVRNRQDKVLGKCVNHGERNRVVVVLAEHGVGLDIRQRVVHPAHVPLEIEPESAHVHGARNAAPRRGLLGNHERIGVLCEHRRIEPPQKFHSLQVLVAAVNIGTPFVAAVIEIQHARHRVHAQAVDMIHIQPIERVAYEEVAHLVSAVIEAARTPFLVLHTQRVAVLIQRTAVELVKPVAVLGKMPGHPIENNAYAAGVHFVYEIRKILGRAEPARRREISRNLISPRPVERVLRDAHKLQMRITELFEVFAHFVGELAVIECIPVRVPPPRRYMRLVNADRLIVRLALVFDIFGVRPLEMLDVHDLSVRSLEGLAVERKRVALIYRIGKAVFYIEFVVIVQLDAAYGRLPNTRLGDFGHAAGVDVPTVEIADYGNRGGAGGPYAENRGFRSTVVMTTQIFIGVVKVSMMICVEQHIVHE